MALTKDHFTRLARFVDARVEERFAGDNYHRALPRYDDSEDARALRALRRAVGNLASRVVLLDAELSEDMARLDHDGSMAIQHRAAGRMTAEFAWNDLSNIARQWKNHPDYHPDFDLLHFQLPDAPAAAEIGTGKD